MDDDERELSERLDTVQAGIDAFERLPEYVRAQLEFSQWWLYALKGAIEHNIPQEVTA